jgi:uncharacterized OB-fold protein
MSISDGLRLAAPQLVELADNRIWLKGGKCQACGKLSFPFAEICCFCQEEKMVPTRLARGGKLYAFSVVHQAAKGWRTPYVLGYVDLADGIRVLAHIDADPKDLSADMPVRLEMGVIRSDSDGTPVYSYVFEPETGARA